MQSRRLFLFLFLPVFFFSCSDSGKDSVVDSDTLPIVSKKPVFKSKDGVVYARLLEKSQRTPYEEASGVIGDRCYYSSYKGKIESSDTIKRVREFIFDLRAEFMIDKMYLYPLGNNTYFINWQETDHNGIHTSAAVIEKGGTKPLWKKDFRVPNPGQAAIDSGSVYITGLGLAAKMNLSNGDFYWLRDSLYSNINQAFQQMQPVVVQADKVFIIDYPITGKRSRCDTLRLHPSTGEPVK